MEAMSVNRRKLLILLLLLAPCAWLVRRNLFPPDSQDARSAQSQALAAAQSGAGGKPAGRARPQILDVDPTLRLDLLEASRAVQYQGSARNIFEVYTPPPAPAPPPPPPTNVTAVQAPTPPRPPVSPLKFYGTAQQSGSPKRAFLTDGEEIMIAKEGEVVAKFYRINRIGVSSLEIEDTRSREKQQLPLLEE